MTMCCDEQPLCGLQRTSLRIVLLFAAASACLAASLYLPFQLGLIRPYGEAAQSTEDDYAYGEEPQVQPQEDGYVMEAILAGIAINAALGFCIASFTVCVWGDVELCALRGSEKRLLWCFLLSPLLGAVCICISARSIFSPTSNECICMLADEHDSEQGSKHEQQARPVDISPGAASRSPTAMHVTAPPLPPQHNVLAHVVVGKVGGMTSSCI